MFNLFRPQGPRSLFSYISEMNELNPEEENNLQESAVLDILNRHERQLSELMLQSSEQNRDIKKLTAVVENISEKQDKIYQLIEPIIYDKINTAN